MSAIGKADSSRTGRTCRSELPRRMAKAPYTAAAAASAKSMTAKKFNVPIELIPAEFADLIQQIVPSGFLPRATTPEVELE